MSFANALARRTAARQGPADPALLREAATQLENETTLFFRTVTAERLRALATELETTRSAHQRNLRNAIDAAHAVEELLGDERRAWNEERARLEDEVYDLATKLEEAGVPRDEPQRVQFVYVMTTDLPPGADLDAVGCELALELAQMLEDAAAGEDEDDAEDADAP